MNNPPNLLQDVPVYQSATVTALSALFGYPTPLVMTCDSLRNEDIIFHQT
jgi:hypothetical protein